MKMRGGYCGPEGNSYATCLTKWAIGVKVGVILVVAENIGSKYVLVPGRPHSPSVFQN